MKIQPNQRFMTKCVHNKNIYIMKKQKHSKAVMKIGCIDRGII